MSEKEEETKTEEPKPFSFGQAPASVFGQPPADKKEEPSAPAGDSTKENEDTPKEEESTATFEPVVKLEEVDVQSGEEEEEAVLTMRGKLFIYGETLLDKGTGNKTWRERGVGDVRIMRHRVMDKYRLLMRQEKTMKVIANLVIDPRIELAPNVSSDRSWVWVAYDFADGELEEKTFALRFANSEIANEFKAKFEECQKIMEKELKGEDAPGDDDGKAADEAAEALAGLSTKEEEKE